MNDQTFSIQKQTSILNSKFWKIVFLLAGIYTAGAVIPGIINPQSGATDFANQTIQDAYSLFFFQSLWITVLVFGLGYLLVASEPARYVGIVILGCMGKLLFAINVFYHYSIGSLSSMAFLAAIVDCIFVALFGVFIYLSFQSRANH